MRDAVNDRLRAHILPNALTAIALYWAAYFAQDKFLLTLAVVCTLMTALYYRAAKGE